MDLDAHDAFFRAGDGAGLEVEVGGHRLAVDVHHGVEAALAEDVDDHGQRLDKLLAVLSSLGLSVLVVDQVQASRIERILTENQPPQHG